MNSQIDGHALRIFVLLARTLNMSSAARELGMTPSAVSHALRKLEEELGCRLFERSSRRVLLTEAGTVILPDAQAILDGLEALRHRSRQLRETEPDRVRIGASATASQFILPPALREFRESFPECSLKIEPCTASQAAAYLGENRIDLAILVEPEKYPSIEYKTIGQDDLQFVVHPLHAWSIKRQVIRREISARNLIVPESGSETFQLIKAYFRREKIPIQPFIEVANEDAIKNFLNLDMGVGILPRWMVADEIERGLLTALPLGRRVLRRRWVMMRRKHAPVSFKEGLLASICSSVIKELTGRLER